ncbi:MAG TPA: hypothetical protein VKV17_21265 [Bryobacteraceae bacterium]|nr:hypothetical protein [Bryobacteraceae bacterium]
MTHLTEEDLILHYYGEAAEPAAAQAHLDACPECRAGFRSLARVLNAMDAFPVPERAADYEAAVWRRLSQAGLRPAFWRRPWGWRRQWLRWPVMGLALASALLAFLIMLRPPARPVRQTQTPAPLSVAHGEAPNEQLFRLALGDYLDRSGIVLTELANTVGGRTVDISAEQERAANLLADCRLYRQTAAGANDHIVAGVLDDLERVLVEIAHAPSRLGPAQADELRMRLRSEGVLFRIRILSSTVRNQS